jgi:hypothetical protein
MLPAPATLRSTMQLHEPVKRGYKHMLTPFNVGYSSMLGVDIDRCHSSNPPIGFTPPVPNSSNWP